jgi:hypothetical protein
LDKEKSAAFENLRNQFQGEALEYGCPYPKHEFLRWLTMRKPVLLHGSNRADIDTLFPRPQGDYANQPRNSVFASSDGIWPIFFATVDHANYRGSFRNACFVVGHEKSIEKRFYFFSLNEAFRDAFPWKDGMIYVLPRKTFSRTCSGLARFDEWASDEAVKPLAKIPVTPQDFPFLENVTWHSETESIYKTWLLFKKRQQG